MWITGSQIGSELPSLRPFGLYSPTLPERAEHVTTEKLLWSLFQVINFKTCINLWETTRPTMDSLHTRMGKRPWKLSQLLTLRSDAAFLMETVNPGNAFDKAAATEMIEILEAFASKLRFVREYLFPDLKEDPHGLPWGDSGRISRNIHYIFTSLLMEITKYKTRLFQALELSALVHPGLGCATVCQYCNWVLERIDRGLQGM